MNAKPVGRATSEAAYRLRWLLLIAATVMSLPMLVAVLVLQQAEVGQRRAAGQARLALARAIAGQVETALASARDGLHAIASQPAMARYIVEGDVDRARAAVHSVRQATRTYRAFAVLDARGEALAVSPPTDLELFDAVRGASGATSVQYGEGVDAVLLVRHPVLAEDDGRVLGSVTAAISLARTIERAQLARFGKTGAATVVDRRSTVIASSDPSRRHHRLSAPPVLELVASGGEGVRSYYAPQVARDEFGAIAPVRGHAVSVVVTQSAEETFAAIAAFQSALLAAMVLITLGGVALSLYALRGYRAYERRLESSNALFTAVTEGTSDIVFVKDRDGRYLLINEAGARFVDRSVDKILGLTDFDLATPATARQTRAADLGVIESGELASGELAIRDAAGNARLLSIVRAPYRDARGNVVGVLGVARDITSAREAEQTIRRQAEELARSNTLLAAVVDNSTDVVYVKDLEERYLLMNEAGAAAVGAPLARVIGRRIDELIPPDQAAPVRARDRRAFADGATVNCEYEVTLDGASRTFQSRVTPWRDEANNIIGLVGISRDITEQERARAALAQSEVRYRDLFEMSKGLICEHDLEGRLLSVNPAAAEMLGYTSGELVGAMLQDFVPEEYRAGFAQYLHGFEEREQQQGVLVLRAKNGEHRHLQFTNRLHVVHDGAPYVIGHANDITERRRYEERLRRLSFDDALTGLYNRRYLAHRQEASPLERFGAIVIDLDHFKQINDTLGHQRGDEVLVEMGRFLQRHVRHEDAVIRMGGDEFLLLLADTDVAATAALAGRIRSDAASAPCGFSIGHAVREPGEPFERTIDRADRTLYRVRVEQRAHERRHP
ncbi:MAG TPA: PAS domain-containing protein [Candidatus Saccharimonadia bacterium]|nr:PAS domain-containing protein [Candidatus Saccharimonadia bacterium]